LRLAMLRYPLRSGPPNELRWFVAETDALNKVRRDAPEGTRERLIDTTRRWIMRDVRTAPESDGASSASPAVPQSGVHVHKMLADLFRHFGASEIEGWSDATWEAFALQSLWRICTEGVHGVKPTLPAPPTPVRHRDLLLLASGADSDLLVRDLLI